MRMAAPACVYELKALRYMRLIFYVFIWCMYIMFGSAMFMEFEIPLETENQNQMDLTKKKFLTDHPSVTDADLEALLDEVVRASNRGVSASKNVTAGPNWSFGQSIFFSTTVVTTIGYGHVTPLTKPGKIFCIVFALLGIPLTLVLLSAIVELLLEPTTAVLRALNAGLGHLFRPFTIRVLHLLIMVVCLVVLCILLPAAVFASYEPGWDYLDAVYYCFISMTTIGLGDYIPGDNRSDLSYSRPLYKILTSFYLILGLSLVMLVLTVFYDIPQLNLSTVFSSVKLDEDPEKMRLSGTVGPGYGIGGAGYGIGGQGYGIGGLVMRDDYNHHDQRRSVVHIRPHLDDSPSPEDTTPVHARDMRVH